MTDPQSVLNALADRTRRSLFERLNSEGPASASTLADGSEVTRQAISKHLDVLHSAGLVERRKVGREILYDPVPERLGEMSEWIDQVGSAWENRLTKLKDSLS